ncbi:type II secretion system GspH family protein [Patescibacteria group bacterium AH-259-L05]|nr:type II secretion system GspH family protein [Patescibacteria group bacterium AH-259-L05]
MTKYVMSKKLKQAFSLVEMLVVIGITAIIAGMVFANMRAGGGIIDLNSNAEKLGAVIKQAQMNTLSGKWTLGSRPDGGYGVYITNPPPSAEYKLFADINSIDSHCYNSGSDTDIQTFSLSNNLELSGANDYFIIFVPPKGAIYVGTTCPGTLLSGSSTSLITLRHTSENRYAYVEVNAQGQIDVRKTP